MSDDEFLDSMEQWVIGSLVFKREHRDRLFALARRGAEAAARIEQLEDANELMLTDIRRTDVDMLAFKARIEQLEEELTIQYQDGHHDGYDKGCTVSTDTAARYDRIEARIAQLEAALKDARVSVEGWADYASDYIKEKWDLKGDLARIDAALEDRT